MNENDWKNIDPLSFQLFIFIKQTLENDTIIFSYLSTLLKKN